MLAVQLSRHISQSVRLLKISIDLSNHLRLLLALSLLRNHHPPDRMKTVLAALLLALAIGQAAGVCVVCTLCQLLRRTA